MVKLKIWGAILAIISVLAALLKIQSGRLANAKKDLEIERANVEAEKAARSTEQKITKAQNEAQKSNAAARKARNETPKDQRRSGSAIDDRLRNLD